MFSRQPLTTRLGWALVTALAIVALIPSTHWLKLLVQGLLFVLALGYIWYVSRPSTLDKVIEIHIEGVEAGERPRLAKRLRETFGERVITVAPSPDATDLAFRLETRDRFEQVIRRLGGLGLPLGLLAVEGRLAYTTTTAHAHLAVEVKGVASPHAKVYLPGVKEAVEADGRGRFAARVPFSIVRRHQSRGYLPGVWRKDNVEQEMRVPIPA